MPGSHTTIRIGTAGWALPGDVRDAFPTKGSRLTRYAQVFNCVEINSTFRKTHRPATFARWRDSVPDDFLFSVKMPQDISHVRRLIGAEGPVADFIAEIAPLQPKLGALLVQLPPSLEFAPHAFDPFFAAMRESYAGPVALEPRHASWASPAALALLRRYRCDGVWADPAVVDIKRRAHPAVDYLRLHGSPRRYYSAYDDAFLDDVAVRLTTAKPRADAWCVFDNTTLGAATSNALALIQRVTALAT